MLKKFSEFEKVRLRRMLGVLLIAFILYGTTVEAAHRHGGVASKTNGHSSLIEDGKAGGLGTTSTGCGDCLICQLHQNFSTTLTVVSLSDSQVQQRYSAPESVKVNAHSQVTSALAGRAPPQIS